MDKVLIARGIAMPFYPMRPATGRVLRNQGNVTEFNEQVLRTHDWIVQPKLSGDRACIGVLDGKIYVQNRHGGWYKHKVENIELFKKLPSQTVLDGEVYKKNFYPFECLAYGGKVLLMNTAGEREIMGMHVCKLLGIPWKFEKPSKRWIAKLRGNAPEYDGVVLKRAASQYIMMGSPDQSHLDWLKRCWG